MIEWIVKKVLCGKINKLLDEYKGDVVKAKTMLQIWTERMEKVLACFKSMLAKLDDNQLSSDEVKEAVDEVNKLVKEW